jgi:transposase
LEQAIVIGALRGVSVWAYGERCDMRKSFNTLQPLVEHEMKRELSTGDLFVFVAKNRRRAKVRISLCKWKDR